METKAMMRLLLVMGWCAGSAHAQQIDTVFPTRGQRVLDLNGATGTVRIQTWARPEIRVQANGVGSSRVKFGSTASGDIAVREGMQMWPVMHRVDTVVYRSNDMAIRYTLAEVRLDTAPAFPDSTGQRNIRLGLRYYATPSQRVLTTPVDYIITVPRHVRVIVRASTSDIVVDGAVDTLDLSTIKGSIRATNLRGSTTLNSLEGRILAEDVRGDLMATTLGGQIVVREAEGTVTAQAVAGTIDLFNVRAATITASTHEGGISLLGALSREGRIELSTKGGPISTPLMGCELFPAADRTVIITPANAVPATVRMSARDTSAAGMVSGPLRNCTLRRD
jgi:hypothetical protein